jgi:type I restriction enzyme S subunit
MANDNKYIPALRFPEFQNDGEWKDTPLGQVFFRITKRNSLNNQNVLTISAQYGLISQYDYFNKNVAAIDVSNYYHISKYDFAYNKSKSQGYPYGAIKPLKLYENGVVSPLYICFRIKDEKSFVNTFFEYYFESELIHKEIDKISQEGARNHGLLNISTKDFFDKITLYIPSYFEQQKIADCFVSIDKEIDATKRKLDLLKEHKKGLMQRLFPAKGKTTPELRFPEFIGTKEWTPKQLGFIGETFGGLSGKSAEDFGTGKPFVTYKQVFNSSEIDFSECALVQVSKNEVQNRLQYGDILVTMSSETPDEVGYTAVVTNKNIPECYLNSFCFIYRLFDDESIDAKFLIYLFSSDVYRTAVVRIAQGITRFNISKTKFKEIELVIPENKNEQIKIAETLSSVDKQIAEYYKKIKALELHKKGLMQQLFPKL